MKSFLAVVATGFVIAGTAIVLLAPTPDPATQETAAPTAPPARPTLDYGKPLFLREGVPWCMSDDALNTLLAAAGSGHPGATEGVRECFVFNTDVPAFVISTTGFIPRRHRLRVILASGRQTEVWTTERALRN